MTKNQIEFLKYQEQQRANMAQETLTRSRDYNNFTLGSRQATEIERHNQAVEQQQRVSLDQDWKKFQQSYGLSVLQLEEQARANRAREDETHRSNQAKEKETTRANVAREALGIQTLIEQQRHNMVGESHDQVRLGIQRDELSERQRSNLASEAIRRNELSEAIRSHKATEGLRSRELGIRANELSSLNQYRGKQLLLDSARLDEQIRSNVASEDERLRSNLAQEALAMQKLDDYYELETRKQEEIERANRSNEAIRRFQVVNHQVNESVSTLANGARYLIPLFMGG